MSGAGGELDHYVADGAEGVGGDGSEVGVAGDDGEADEDAGHHGVAGGQGVVGDVAGADYEVILVGAGVVEAAGKRVPEERYGLTGESSRPR